MTYYNTNGDEGIYLREAWTQTAKQDELIYQLFLDNPEQGYSPEDVESRCLDLGKEWPITSVRRAMSTLTKQGKLTKTSELQKSSYGKNAHIWRFNAEVNR